MNPLLAAAAMKAAKDTGKYVSNIGKAVIDSPENTDEVEKRLNLPKGSIQKMAEGKEDPKFSTVVGIAALLGTSIDKMSGFAAERREVKAQKKAEKDEKTALKEQVEELQAKVDEEEKAKFFKAYRELNKKGDAYIVMAGADDDFASKVPSSDVLVVDKKCIELKDEFEKKYGEDLHQEAAKYEGREILFEYDGYILSAKDGHLWYMNEADQKGWVVPDTLENRSESSAEAVDKAVKKERLRLYGDKIDKANRIAEDKCLFSSEDDISNDVDYD